MAIANGKVLLITLLAGASFLFGAAAQYFEPGVALGKVAVAATLIVTLLIFLWFRLDAQERGYNRSIWLNVAVVAFALVAIPYYFYRSRAPKQASVATFAFVVVLIASFLLEWLGAIAVWVTLQS